MNAFVTHRLARIKATVLVAALLSLSSCGFHLRGSIEIPRWLDSIAIIHTGYYELNHLLKQQFEAYHILVQDDPSQANYWLFIQSESFQQQISSVSSSTTPRQYQLTYIVQFRLQSRQGREVIPSGQIVSTRQLTVNSDRILGSDDEEAILKQEMRRDLVIQLMNRLSRHTT